MIILQDVKKSYFSKNNTVHALKKVNLHIRRGEIFGIIGYSGAGKSTLIRCINLLERPTSGKVFVNGIELTSLSEKELRKSREKIGMIFQHFNLMNSRNVFKNVAYPLRGKGLSKDEIRDRVFSLLELVGLKDKAYSYPSQLSGGQKQRVAIARALANDPEVLLCDEATSALDPQTTQSILRLLKDINEKLNLTIVLISHQMEVVKEICDRIAVMENGEIVEEGNIVDIFSNPKANITREFIASAMHYDKIYEILERDPFIRDLSKDDVVAKISFVGQNTGQAFISKISIEYRIHASILFGNVESIQGVPVGNLIVHFTGEKEKIQRAIKYLEDSGIKVEVIKSDGVIEFSDAKRNRAIS